MGDPETQPVLMRMKSDIIPVIEAAIDGKLNEIKLEWYDEATVCVVMASGGYPKSYEKGYEITGIEDAEKSENIKVFHAGTKIENGKLINSGGRVLGVTARHKDLKVAIQDAYKAVEKINWKDVFYRKDIGKKALDRI
jgi:phosphoribosylamine--glycine ligase